MTSSDIAIGSLITGPLISWVVSGLKRIPFVKRYPKVATAVLSSAIPSAIAIYGATKGVDIATAQQLAVAVATQFTAAVATHETVTQPLNKLRDGD